MQLKETWIFMGNNAMFTLVTDVKLKQLYNTFGSLICSSQILLMVVSWYKIFLPAEETAKEKFWGTVNANIFHCHEKVYPVAYTVILSVNSFYANAFCT